MTTTIEQLMELGKKYGWATSDYEDRRTGENLDAMELAEQELRSALVAALATTGPAIQGQRPETIVWVDAVHGAPMPVPFEMVLLEVEEEADGAWPGCWDGEHWLDADCGRIKRNVLAWSKLPLGRKGGAQ